MLEWFQGLDQRLQAGFLAGSFTIIGILLKDWFLAWRRERRSAHQSTVSVYRRYADPLTSAATSLLWRLDEILNKGRNSYLQPTDEPTPYERYKQVSTLYRLANLIGWLRAYRRELTFLPEIEPGKLNAIQKAIENFESALADGSHVELRRLDSLLRLWLPEGPELAEEQKAEAAIALDISLKQFLHQTEVHLATDLSSEAQYQLCQEIAELLAAKLNINPISEAILNETKARAIQSLSVRESWLYRDVQAGIGDLMIRDFSSTTRRFEVIGYRDFEALVYQGSHEEKRWIQRLENTIDNLNVSGADHFDARVELLKNTLRATAGLVLALDNAEHRSNLVSEEARKLAGNCNNSNGSVNHEATP